MPLMVCWAFSWLVGCVILGLVPIFLGWVRGEGLLGSWGFGLGLSGVIGLVVTSFCSSMGLLLGPWVAGFCC